MNFGKTVKIITMGVIGLIVIGFAMLFAIIAGVVAGFTSSSDEKIETNYELATSLKNSDVYATPYKRVLNRYLGAKGYVSLERMVFYLQRTNNVLDVSTLDDSKWNEAYLNNLNEEEKQMVPIGQICSSLKDKTFTVKSDGRFEIIDLCSKDNLENSYKNLPYVFPLKTKFTVTSFTNEKRNVYGKENTHNGWDLAVKIGTDFYSICDGEVSNIVNTQMNDLPYNKSLNSTGNYVKVKCDNGLTAIYYHIKYKSTPSGIKVHSRISKGDKLGKTSTTGYSTGPHLHVGLVDVNKNILDPMDYIDMKSYK